MVSVPAVIAFVFLALPARLVSVSLLRLGSVSLTVIVFAVLVVLVRLVSLSQDALFVLAIAFPAAIVPRVGLMNPFCYLLPGKKIHCQS